MAEKGLSMYKGDDGFKVKPGDTQPKKPGLSEGPVLGPKGLDAGKSFDKTTPSYDAKEMPPKGGDGFESPTDK